MSRDTVTETSIMFDERMHKLPEATQELLRHFFGLGCYTVADAIVIWMNSIDCSGGAREMILNYREEYDKIAEHIDNGTL